ncbi:MAG: flagellar export chaperone FliS [Firmicutes bacterium]|nr:flagellar export chaperone FliS [Bacillota bacterium]
MLPNPYQKYQKTMVETVTPAQLVLMLYNGAIRFLKQAQMGLEEGKLEVCHQNILKAQDILTELMTSLDLEQGEIARNLYQLYDYMYHRLVDANIKKDGQILLEVQQFLSELRETWSEAIKLS